MSLKSMTGFGRHEAMIEAPTGTVSWTWEARSVNGKNLDVRLRLPQGLEGIEATIKKAVQGVCGRGNVALNLSINNAPDTVLPAINQEVLDVYLKAANDLVEQGDAVVSPASGLLALKGVLDYQDTTASYEEIDGFHPALLSSLTEVLSALVAARSEEGTALLTVLSDQLDEMASLVAAASSRDKERLPHRKEKLKEQVALLLESGADLGEDRLAQELAVIAVKADISEEIDRLEAHIQSARSLLGSKDPVGRRLDFLCQEFNREANTLCSKSGDAALTEIGLDLKTLIDRFREQVQNVE